MSKIFTYKLAAPTWDEQEMNAIRLLIEKQQTSMGEAVFAFEREFASYVGSKYAVMVNSGSSANLLMTAALCYTQPKPLLKAGDEVICPALSWPTTFYPLQQYGLHIKFVDIDLHTLNYDLDALSKAVSEKTKAIMAVNLLGNSNDFDIINSIINGKNIILIEDNCESLGSTYHAKYTGTFGLMGTFSFFFSHHISTMEGGMIVTDDDHLHDILLCLRAHGWTRNLKTKNTLCTKSDNIFMESWRFLLPGYNVRPLEIEGAIGREQLKKLPRFLNMRRKNAVNFINLFQDDPDFLIQRSIGKSSWFGFSFIIRPDTNLRRDDIVSYLIENGVECRQIVSGNFVAKDVMRFFDYSIFGSLKNASYVDANGFFIGNDHLEHKDDIKYVRYLLDNFVYKQNN